MFYVSAISMNNALDKLVFDNVVSIEDTQYTYVLTLDDGFTVELFKTRLVAFSKKEIEDKPSKKK